jgi:glycosyltransferase involved in cell wall biosynthesis
MRETGAQVFHGANFETPWMGSAPAVVTVHDLSPWKDPAWHIDADRVRRRTPWLLRLRRARIVITVTEAMRKEVIEHFHLDPAKVRAIHLGARPCGADPPVRGGPPGPPHFLCVATLEPRKNIPALVEAWRATRSETRAELWLAGRMREDFTPIPPEPGLRLLGEVPDEALPALYSGALAFVYPTLYEGFGLPVLEAMQYGCPVITTNDPAVVEVSAGNAIHVGTAEEMGRAMTALATQPELRAAQREKGLKRSAEFSWSKTARASRAIYQEIARV